MKTASFPKSKYAVAMVAGWISLLAVVNLTSATVRYVDVNNSSPTPPYTNWATAATTIQAAIDAATAGDEIVVTNGVYATGGRAVHGTMTNRVAVTKPVLVRSVNGPQFTIIQGHQVPGTINGDGAIRCVYLAEDANLSGFTLTNGWAQNGGGGGVYCESTSEMVSNCVLVNNGASYGGGAYGGTLNNCALTNNSAGSGGGAHRCTLNNCTLTGNSARDDGGGAFLSTMNNCTLTGNSAGWAGGGCVATEVYVDGPFGSSVVSLSHCTFTGNMATNGQGGGVDGGILNNCVLSGNSATGESGTGGGVYRGTLNNCALTGNSATEGGGAYWSALNNCTVTGNSALSHADLGGVGGGVLYCRMNNCIVYFNTATQYAANYDSGSTDSTLTHCCTTPQPEYWQGDGNITLDPQLASASHLSANSPCRGAGSAEFATATDIDGEAWANPPSIGCDEYYAGAVTGSLGLGIASTSTTVVPGYALSLTGLIEGRVLASIWDFGDGVTVTNQPYTSHVWTVKGDYPVVLWAYNESHPEGVSTSVIIHVDQPVHYVAASSTRPLAPYTSWATAATNIQDAVDAATVPGALILVTNGVYAAGGRPAHVGAITNRVTLDRFQTLRSVNGPQFTVIQGHQVPGTTNGDEAIRCVYLTSGSSLTGFTLTNGATRVVGAYEREQSGGGLWCESVSAIVSNCVVAGNAAANYGGGAYSGTLNNCTLTANWASAGGGASEGTLNNCAVVANSARIGGGSYRCTLNNCTLAGNSATYNDGYGGYGGGACDSTLRNCTLTGNSARFRGGGSFDCNLNNSIVYFNTAANSANFYHAPSRVFNFCCTTPLPASGISNITNAPGFVNPAAGDFHLRHDSPCIDAGTNLSAFFTHDLDGNLRPLDGNGDGLALFDIGAYEFDRRSCMPVLTAQPQSQTVNEGGTATFTVAADGLTPFLYQWRFNGSDISAATNSWLTLTGVQATQAGLYSVRVTNDCGDVVSSNALLRVNRPPVADASATPTLVISANGIDARVGLDGSRSSDPEGDPLEYQWFSTLNAQPSTPLAAGLVAVVVLPVGISAVQLVVSDGLASSTNTVVVTVLTTGQGIQRLIALANGANLPHAESLLKKLERALAFLHRSHPGAAANQLRAFQNKVRAQVAPEDPTLADTLIVAAQQVIDALGGRPGRMGGKIRSLKHQPGGKVQLKFTGTVGGVHVIEASTNLVDWETIGVAVDRGDGQFEFEDAQAHRFPTRFYRLVVP